MEAWPQLPPTAGIPEMFGRGAPAEVSEIEAIVEPDWGVTLHQTQAIADTFGISNALLVIPGTDESFENSMTQT
jgi:hypothetical protein